MKLLQAIGRSGAIPAIMNMQEQREQRAQQKAIQDRSLAMQDMQMKNMQQQMDIRKRQEERVMKEEARMYEPLDAVSLMTRFEGGIESPMAKHVYDRADQLGYIDKSQGGLGTITRRNMMEMAKVLNDPVEASTLSRMRIGYYRSQAQELREAIKKKPTDEKLIAQLQKVELGLHQALGQDTAMMNYLKNQKPEETGLPEGYFKVGSKLYQLQDGKVVPVDAPTEGTAAFRDWQLAQKNPGYAEHLKDMKGAGAARVNVSTGKEEDAFSGEADKVLARKVGEAVMKRAQAAEEARSQSIHYETIALSIANGARTGFGEETLLNVKSAAQTLGFDVGDLSGQELIRHLSNKMALRLRNPDSGLGLTGNTSNKDLEFLKASVPGLGRTEAGNLKIIDLALRVNKYRIAIAAEQDRLIAENDGSIPRDLNTKLRAFADNYQFFTPEERQQIEGLLDQGKPKTDGFDKYWG